MKAIQAGRKTAIVLEGLLLLLFWLVIFAPFGTVVAWSAVLLLAKHSLPPIYGARHARFGTLERNACAEPARSP